ncbi:MAG: hypothetical protein ABL900_13310 [Burkholderiaceae bacterium]
MGVTTRTRRPAQLALGAVWLVCAAALGAPDLAGRWEGVAEIPGAPLRVVLDVAPRAAGGWEGSVVLPGRSVKGAPLRDIEVDERALRFSLAAAFSYTPGATPAAHLTWRPDGALAGELRQGRLAAPLLLQRTGPPQVDRPIAPTLVTASLEGTWVGRYEIGGMARDVTLTLANRPQGMALGELLIVGRRTSKFVVDHVVQGAEFITLRSTEADYRIEGRWANADGSIRGQVVQGPFEAHLVLRKQLEKQP